MGEKERTSFRVNRFFDITYYKMCGEQVSFASSIVMHMGTKCMCVCVYIKYISKVGMGVQGAAFNCGISRVKIARIVFTSYSFSV